MTSADPDTAQWSTRVRRAVRPYCETAPLAALALGISSGAAFAMIGATLTTRLAQYGIRKGAVTAFSLTFLAYNLKFLWSPFVDTAVLPVLGRYGQRRSWLLLTGVLVMAAVVHLGNVDPVSALPSVATAAILVGIAGATFDIVIDAYRIELLEPRQLGVGAGMSQYGWRIGASTSGALALLLAARHGWATAYAFCALFALPAMLAGLWIGEPTRRQPSAAVTAGVIKTYVSPLVEFLRRPGALAILAFVIVHKIGDTLANLTLRLLYADQGYTNEELAFYEVGIGFVALLCGVFAGGWLFDTVGLKRSVSVGLVLMAVSNLGFAGLAAFGHSNAGLAAATAFETFTSGAGGVAVVAYLSSLCSLRFTGAQYALLSALASVAGRVLAGTTAGGLIEITGYVNFYVLTTLAALPGVGLYAYLVKAGLADASGEPASATPSATTA